MKPHTCSGRLTALLTVCLISSSAAALQGGVYYDLGPVVVGGWQRTVWTVYDPVLKQDVIWSQECSQDGAVLYGLDINSGKVLEEHDVPARELGHILLADDGVMFIYTYSGLNHPGNELLKFDPRKRKIERLGLADTPRNRCVSGVIGKDGNVYIGTHQEGRLFRFDTKTGQWTDLGQKVPAPVRRRQNIWLRNLQVLADGRILASVGRTPPDEVVVIDRDGIAFRKVHTLHSANYRVFGKLVLVPTAEGIRIYDSQFKPLADLTLETLESAHTYPPSARLAMLIAHAKAGVLARVGDDLVHVDIEQKRVRRLARFPFPGSFLVTTDGQKAVVIDHLRRRFAVLDLKTGNVVKYPISYVGKRGTQICGLNKAADGSIYGSTIISMHIFRHDPKTGNTHDLGHVGWGGGEVYNLIDYDGQVYFGTYGGAYWGHYDPSRPWNPDLATQGTAADANPQNLGHLGGDHPHDANRPFEYAIGPDQRIYIACRANYGRPGGCLARFDPRTGEKQVFRYLKRSVQTVTADDRYIYCGTNVHGGRGSGDRAETATLAVHDPKTGKRVFEEALLPNAKAIVSIRYNKHDGQVYASSDNRKLIAFDPRRRQVTGSWEIRSAGTPLAGVPEDVGMIHITVASDGNIYGVTRTDLFRFDVKARQIEYLEKPPIPDLYQIVEGPPGIFYMGARTHLLRYHVNSPPYFR